MYKLIQYIENKCRYKGRWAGILAILYSTVICVGILIPALLLCLAVGSSVVTIIIPAIGVLVTAFLTFNRVSNTPEGSLASLLLVSWWWIINPWLFIEWVITKRCK